MDATVPAPDDVELAGLFDVSVQYLLHNHMQVCDTYHKPCPRKLICRGAGGKHLLLVPGTSPTGAENRNK